MSKPRQLVIDGKTICKFCNQERHLSEMLMEKYGDRVYLHGRCLECARKYQREWCKRNPDKIKRKYLKARIPSHLRRHGESYNVFLSRLAAQNGLCANPSCGIVLSLEGHSSTKAHQDHNHDTGQKRGILCHGCNTALGLLKEKAEVIEGLAAYIRKWNPPN